MIKQINTSYGRFYETPDGTYPSVTSILGSIPNPHIDKWREEVGEEVANKISKKATVTGTRFHQYCEDYLNKKPYKLDIFDKQSFKDAENTLKHINPVFVERGLWSKTLRVAGTIDCFGSYKGKIFLIDFKTTKRDKYPGEFDSYWMQTAAYARMVSEWSNKPITDLMIMMQNIDSGSTELYFEKTDNWIDRFITLRNSYTKEYHGN